MSAVVSPATVEQRAYVPEQTWPERMTLKDTHNEARIGEFLKEMRRTGALFPPSFLRSERWMGSQATSLELDKEDGASPQPQPHNKTRAWCLPDQFPLKLSLPQPCGLVALDLTLSLEIPIFVAEKIWPKKLRLMRRQWELRRHLCAMRGAKSDLGICTSQIQISHTEARKGDKQQTWPCVK